MLRLKVPDYRRAVKDEKRMRIEKGKGSTKHKVERRDTKREGEGKERGGQRGKPRQKER